MWKIVWSESQCSLYYKVLFNWAPLTVETVAFRFGSTCMYLPIKLHVLHILAGCRVFSHESLRNFTVNIEFDNWFSPEMALLVVYVIIHLVDVYLSMTSWFEFIVNRKSLKKKVMTTWALVCSTNCFTADVTPIWTQDTLQPYYSTDERSLPVLFST